jgi:hypothetical protein
MEEAKSWKNSRVNAMFLTSLFRFLSIFSLSLLRRFTGERVFCYLSGKVEGYMQYRTTSMSTGSDIVSGVK